MKTTSKIHLTGITLLAFLITEGLPSLSLSQASPSLPTKKIIVNSGPLIGTSGKEKKDQHPKKSGRRLTVFIEIEDSDDLIKSHNLEVPQTPHALPGLDQKLSKLFPDLLFTSSRFSHQPLYLLFLMLLI